MFAKYISPAAKAFPKEVIDPDVGPVYRNTPIGIVYETDAKIEPNVKIIGAFPDGSYPPVTYPVAATANAKADAAKYLDFLRGGTAKAIFEKYGFSILAGAKAS